MIFPQTRAAPAVTLQILLLAVLVLTGCQRPISDEQKAVRAELREALRERAFDRAIELAQQQVAAAPRENGGWERLVRAQLGLGDTAGAKETLTVWRKNVRKPSPKYHEFSGDIAAKEQNASAALASWSRSLAARPKNVRVLRKLARLHRAERNWQEQDAALSKILALGEDAAARIERALCRRRMHRWVEAHADLARARELAPDDPRVRDGAELFARLAPVLPAIRALDARVAVTPGDGHLLADRALLFLRSEDAELALDDSEAAAKAAPWAVRPRLFQGIALLSLNRKEDAEKLGVDSRLRLSALTPEFLETISRLDSEVSVERRNAELYVTRAWHLNEIGQPKLALEDAEMAQRLDPKSAGAFAEGGYALAKLERSDDAFEQVKRATELDANYSTGWHYRGELEMSRGDHAAAIESLTRALAINQTAAALQKREECYVRLGLLAKAEEDHRALQEMNTRGLQ